MVLYYNDMFEEAGPEVPKTWDEWKDAAEKLTKDTDGDGEPDIYGKYLLIHIHRHSTLVKTSWWYDYE